MTDDAQQERKGSSLKTGTTEVSGLTIVLVVLAVLCLAGGLFVEVGDALILVGAAGVLAIFARLAQSGRQHAELMDILRESRQHKE